MRALRRRLQEHRERLRWLTGRAALVSPATRLSQQLLRLENLDERLYRAWRHALDSRREQLLPLVRTLNAVSPLATLERGYAIVSIEGGRSCAMPRDAKPGTIIEARLARGRIRAKVEARIMIRRRDRLRSICSCSSPRARSLSPRSPGPRSAA